MLYILVVIVALGSTFYFMGVGSRLRTCIWKASVWLVDPNAGSEEDTSAGAAVGGVMSVCGLIIFAFLLTLLQEAFAHYLDTLREGQSPVVERGHILLIGITRQTIGIIQEFCMANAATGGTCIVVLAEHMSKPEMERLIQLSISDKLGSRVVVRGGLPHHAEDLKHVAADTAGTIVLMPDFMHGKETRDASILHTLITLHGQGWPTDGQLIAVCSLVKNRPIFKRIGGPHALIVILDVFLARIIVQCTNHFGIGRIVNKTFGFEDSEFYFAHVPNHLVGKHFVHASAYYPDAVLVGVVQNEQHVKKTKSGRHALRQQRSMGSAFHEKVDDGKSVQLCPPMNRVLQKGDELVLIAEDSAGALAKEKPCIPEFESPGQAPVASQMSREISEESMTPLSLEPQAENILILGWNNLSGMILGELDVEVAEGSTVTIMAPIDTASREAFIEKSLKRWNRRIENITNIVHIQADLGSHVHLENLQVEEATRIIILSAQDHDEPSAQQTIADACTFAMVLQLEHILEKRLKSGKENKLMPIVAEIRDTLSAQQIAATKVADFINLSSVPAQVLAMIAHQPRIMEVLELMISDHAVTSFAIQSLDVYLEPGKPIPEKISFFEARHAAHKCGDIVIGWSAPSEKQSKTQKSIMGTEWLINPPDKTKPREWSPEFDRLVVLKLDPQNNLD